MGQAIGNLSHHRRSQYVTGVRDIDILTDDALIVIFSFLTLYDRLKLMRVSRRFHRLLSCSEVWTHIDFWQEQRLTKKQMKTMRKRRKKKNAIKREQRSRRRRGEVEIMSEPDITWLFPLDKESVLDFVRKYASRSLKSIYLRIVSQEILTHLKQNCPNLEVLSFLSSHDPPLGADSSPLCKTPFSIEEVIPKNLKVFEFSLFDQPQPLDSMRKFSNSLLNYIAKCTSIERVTFRGIFVNSEGCIALSNSRVTNISLLSVLSFNDDDVNLAPLSNLTEITSFRFSDSYYRLHQPGSMCSHPTTTLSIHLLDTFLCNVTEKWQHLRCLALKGMWPLSQQTMLRMTIAWPQLQVLELYSKAITDENIALIAEHLKVLNILKLTDGHYSLSGIKIFRGHPSINRLYLLQNNYNTFIVDEPSNRPAPDYQMASPEWLMAVYDVIESLPKITYVKLAGVGLVELHAEAEIPEMTRNIDIEVDNAKVYYKLRVHYYLV